MKKLVYLLLFIPSFVQGQIVIDSYTSFPVQGGGTSLNVPGLISLWDTTSIDATATAEGDDVDLWTDTEGSNNATQTGTTSPELHIGTTGGSRQVTFDGTDWLNLGKPSNLNFIPQTDEFSIVARLGDNIPTQGYIISKADATSSLRQWGIYHNSTSNMGTFIGGQDTVSSTFFPQGNDLYILTVSTANQTLRANGNVIIDNVALTGTATSDVDINIGGRSNGGYLLNGDLEFIAVYNKVLSASEITAIETEFNLN